MRLHLEFGAFEDAVGLALDLLAGERTTLALPYTQLQQLLQQLAGNATQEFSSLHHKLEGGLRTFHERVAASAH